MKASYVVKSRRSSSSNDIGSVPMRRHALTYSSYGPSARPKKSNTLRSNAVCVSPGATWNLGHESRTAFWSCARRRAVSRASSSEASSPTDAGVRATCTAA